MNKYGILRALNQDTRSNFNTLMGSPLQALEEKRSSLSIFSKHAVQVNYCPSNEIIESIS